MVGWWKTLIGDLYEQVTIWEYDDMAAFERAIQFLSKNAAFARFVAARDPLLAGEESRFLRLAPGGGRPPLPDPAPFVVHEIHRVPLARRDAYLAFMTRQGLDLLKAHGFRPAGPWVSTWADGPECVPFPRRAWPNAKAALAQFSTTPDGTCGAKVGIRRRDRPAFSSSVRAGAGRPPETGFVRGAGAAPGPAHRGDHVAGSTDTAPQTAAGSPRGPGDPADRHAPRDPWRNSGLGAPSTGKSAPTLVLTFKTEISQSSVSAQQGITRVLTSPGPALDCCGPRRVPSTLRRCRPH
jgi:hypothetical protein